MARERRGLTLTALSALSGISTRMLSRYENNKTEPGEDKIEALAAALSFPTSFFYRERMQAIPAEGVSFRSLQRMPAKQRDAVLRMAEAAWELDEWFDGRFDRPGPDLPDLSEIDDPKAAAAALRADWGLGERPIPHLVRLLEAKGVRIYSLESETPGELDPRNVHGLSMWWHDRPFIFLGPLGTAERMRMNAAHELAHLVLHRHGALTGQLAEKQAASFAGSFLVPTRDLLANAPRPELRSIIRAKERWGVAAIALVYRMREEGLIPQWRYQDLCVRIRSRYGSEEPNEARPESSVALPKMLDALRVEGVRRQQIANDLGVYIEDVDALLRSLVTLPEPSISRVQPEAHPAGERRLRLER